MGEEFGVSVPEEKRTLPLSVCARAHARVHAVSTRNYVNVKRRPKGHLDNIQYALIEDLGRAEARVARRLLCALLL